MLMICEIDSPGQVGYNDVVITNQRKRESDKKKCVHNHIPLMDKLYIEATVKIIIHTLMYLNESGKKKILDNSYGG